MNVSMTRNDDACELRVFLATLLQQLCARRRSEAFIEEKQVDEARGDDSKGLREGGWGARVVPFWVKEVGICAHCIRFVVYDQNNWLSSPNRHNVLQALQLRCQFCSDFAANLADHRDGGHRRQVVL